VERERSNLFAFRSGLCFGLRSALFVACLCGFLGTRRGSGRVVLSDTFDSSGHRVISVVVSALWGRSTRVDAFG
jgi:hypothetical protein